ncbi:outer membrane beta-barrel protein [Thermodesulfobacteriota bacterium]
MFSKRKTNKIGLFCIILIILLICPFSAYSKGKITVKPKLSASWRTDDNFHKAETSEREVRTYIIQPGIQIGYESPKSLVTFDYTLGSYNYDETDPLPAGLDSAENDDFTGHTALFDLVSKTSSRVTLGLKNQYFKTRDSAKSDTFSNSIDRDKYSINTLTPSILYNLGGKFSAGFRFRHTETEYDVAAKEGSTEYRPIFDLLYNFNKTTSLDLEWQYWERDFDLSSDYESIQTKLILRKQYKYFSFEAGAGYQNRDFDSLTQKDMDVIAYRFAITGQGPKSHVSLIAESNLNDSGGGVLYFVATRVTLKAGRVFMGKIPVELSGMFQNSDYEDSTGLTPAGTVEIRDDDLSSIEGSVGYIFNDWLNFTVTAGHEKRDSNMAGKNYDNNYLSFNLNFNYSFGKR